ncbi:hypothetical protein MKX03_004160, partial [Papaver bracteatum]
TCRRKIACDSIRIVLSDCLKLAMGLSITIRWKELEPHVTQFVLLEVNSTFTGIPKPLYFANHREHFIFVERYEVGLRKGESILSGHTINLLRWCADTPPVLHLRIKNYLYSFEFPIDNKSWRASVHQYKVGKTRYALMHIIGRLMISCQCMETHISEFIFKMKAYSHYDRVRFKYYLDPKRIQDVICKGANLFDMLPEEYTFKDIIGKLGPIPHSFSAVHLPAHLLNNAEKYKYLLPGNCNRESG